MTPWIVVHQGLLSMEFYRQEYWSRLPFPSPGDLLDPGIEPRSPSLQADSLPPEPAGKPKIHESESRSVVSKSLQPYGCTVHGILQARKLQWVAFPFSRGSSKPRDPTQFSQHCRWILYQLSHKGSPRILEWVAYPFSSVSS